MRSPVIQTPGRKYPWVNLRTTSLTESAFWQKLLPKIVSSNGLEPTRLRKLIDWASAKKESSSEEKRLVLIVGKQWGEDQENAQA